MRDPNLKQRIPCIMRISIFGAFSAGKKCSLYTGKYGISWLLHGISLPVSSAFTLSLKNDNSDQYVHLIFSCSAGDFFIYLRTQLFIQCQRFFMSFRLREGLDLSNFATRGDSTLLVFILCPLSFWFLSQSYRFFGKSRSAFWWKWRSKHCLPHDLLSWNRVHKELWEIVILICDWFILICSQDLSHEQFTRSVLRNKSQGLVPKIQTTLN